MIGKSLLAPVRIVGVVLRGLGPRRVVLLGVGAAIGAFVTPISGPELRRRVIVAIAKRRAGAEPTVEERVRRRLAESPRTWHLPQPEVVAVPGDTEAEWRIILAGIAPDDDAKNDFEVAARGVTGVSGVDNRIRVDQGEER